MTRIALPLIYYKAIHKRLLKKRCFCVAPTSSAQSQYLACLVQFLTPRRQCQRFRCKFLRHFYQEQQPQYKECGLYARQVGSLLESKKYTTMPITTARLLQFSQNQSRLRNNLNSITKTRACFLKRDKEVTIKLKIEDNEKRSTRQVWNSIVQQSWERDVSFLSFFLLLTDFELPRQHSSIQAT